MRTQIIEAYRWIMNREFMLLQSIDENNSISQRQLAKLLEVSLGTVNAMISQLLKDGYVIAEHTQAKQSKYFLTSAGKEEKRRLEYAIICNSFNIVSKTRQKIKQKLTDALETGAQKFYLLGEWDEFRSLIKMVFIELKRKYPLTITEISEIGEHVHDTHSIVVYWKTDHELDDINNKIMLP